MKKSKSEYFDSERRITRHDSTQHLELEENEKDDVNRKKI